MKTPFTLLFNEAGIPLVRVSRRPFVPRYPMPYVAEENTAYYVGDGCQVIYRWHDAFDVFVAELEVRFANGDTPPLEIPIRRHLDDLHLVYQQTGDTAFLGPHLPDSNTQTVTLPARHHMEVFAPPGRVLMRIKPDPTAQRSGLTVVVPKADWLARHPPEAGNPLDELIHSRKTAPGQHRYIGPTALTANVLALLHLLLNLPSYPDIRMDDELNGPVVGLVQAHRQEYEQQGRRRARETAVASARVLAGRLVALYQAGDPLTAAEIATALHTDLKSLNRWHKKIHRETLHDYVESIRYAQAKRRLAGGVSVTQVALQMGYSSASNFTRGFRMHFGQTPSEYAAALDSGNHSDKTENL